MKLWILKLLNIELELLVENTISFKRLQSVKLIRERQLSYMRFSFEYGLWFQSYQWLINLRLFLPIFFNLFGIFSKLFSTARVPVS